MSIPFLSDTDVQDLLVMSEVIEENESAFRAAGAGKVDVPERPKIVIPGHGATLFKPAYIPASPSSLTSESETKEDASALGIKIVSVRPDNVRRSLPTVPAVMLMVDVVTGFPSAVIEATALTAIRTAAGSAVATKLLAPSGAKNLVVFGAGLQARYHAEAMLEPTLRGKTLKHVVFINRDKDRAGTLADQLAKRYEGVTFASLASGDVDDVRAAVEGAHLIVTATGASEPLFDGRWLNAHGAGVHINAVGSYTPSTREIDTVGVSRARIVLDSEEAGGVGDIVMAQRDLEREGGSKLTVLGTLGEMLLDPARLQLRGDSAGGITLFKSVGTAIQDVATGRLAFAKWTARGKR